MTKRDDNPMSKRPCGPQMHGAIKAHGRTVQRPSRHGVACLSVSRRGRRASSGQGAPVMEARYAGAGVDRGAEDAQRTGA